MCICTQTDAGICSFFPYSQTILADDGKQRKRKRIAFSDAVRSRRALRTLWHNACISYRRYEKSVNEFRSRIWS